MGILGYLRGPGAPGTVAFSVSVAALVAFFTLFSRLQGDVSSTPQAVCFWTPWVAAVAVLLVTVIRRFRSERSAPVYNLLVAFGSALLASGFMFVSLAFTALFDDSPDPFGRDIVIPEGMHMRLPSELAPDESPTGTTSDPDGDAVKAACSGALPDDAVSRKVSYDLRALDSLRAERARTFQDQLARDPAWSLQEEGGRLYAFRRFLSPRGWSNSMNGFSSFENCQVRIVIAFDGPIFEDVFARSLEVTSAGTSAQNLELEIKQNAAGSLGSQSYLVIKGAEVALEIFDDSKTQDRGVTRAALRVLERELAAIGGKPARAPTIDDRPSTIELVQGMQGGLYTVSAPINPGERGRAYLKVYEQTRNTQLSAEEVTTRSQQLVGWSDDPRERFRYQVDVTIYEGDWGVYYPARFELWFAPASGAAERKLLEDVFRIEGWQR